MYPVGMTDVSVPNTSMIPQGVSGGTSVVYPKQPGYSMGNIPVTDIREFQKVNYNACIRTRNVPVLVRRVETTVHGYGGRIDQESSSPKSGYISFVVPMSKYDSFRNELESMVNSRFITINIQSSNMLPQKQGIEDQQKQADNALTKYQTSRQKLVDAHASTVKSLQSQIYADTQQLAHLRAQTSTYDIQSQI
jgi:hypothetical protein